MLFIKDLAGEGAFGYVAKAEAFQLPNTSTPCTVAVKMLKGWQLVLIFINGLSENFIDLLKFSRLIHCY